MKKMFEAHEALSSILLIAVYVIVESYCIQHYGTMDYRSVLVNTACSGLLIALVAALGRVQYYGLTAVHHAKSFLFFLPLIAIASVNLWNGIQLTHTGSEIFFHVLTMINVGFLEELIFRGFLFKMMEPDGVRSAIVVSALTFGIGHIVNLLNGADLIPTLIQVCYAAAIGLVFVMVFYTCHSLWPCIFTHMFINATSILNVENTTSRYLVPIFMIVVAIGYSLYLKRLVRIPEEGSAHR